MLSIDSRSSGRIRRLQQMVQAPFDRGVAAARERAASELVAAREVAASELAAARDGLPVGPGGSLGFRKWLGWKLYHVAARVNPEIGDL